MDEAKSRPPRASGAIASPPGVVGGIEKIIKAAVDRGASDLHIKAGDVFRARIDGKLVPLTKQLISNEEDQAKIDRLRDYDCSWGMPGVGRFRVNVLRQRSSFMIVMRVVPFDVPSFESLGLPAVLRTVALSERGLVLVTGPAGSGKSSTMAAMVNHINQHEQRHIVTLENPIEFLHRDVNSSITQREIGVDTDDYRRGLRAALRQDPDVVLVGEVRDAPVLDTALRAAETGHLVISALDTSIRGGRPSPELQAYIRTSRERHGTQTLDQHLFDLVAEGVVTHEAAIAAAPAPAQFAQLIRGLDRRPPPAPVSPRPAAAAREAPIPDDLSSPLPGQ